MEAMKLREGKPGARNWTPEQRIAILEGKTPKDIGGVSIQGHHRYDVSNYPHLANKGKYVYPATRAEHLYRWHGGNWHNTVFGGPLDPGYPEGF